MREIVKQAGKTAIAVRLVHGDDAPLAGLPRRGQHSLDFNRMMTVIVEDLHAIGFARQREAAFDAGKGGKPLLDVGFRNTETIGDGNRRRRIRNIVAAGHRQNEIREGKYLAGAATTDFHIEDGPRAVDAHIRKPHIRLRVFAIGDNLAVLDPANERLNLGWSRHMTPKP